MDIEEFQEATFEEAKGFVSSKGLKSLKQDDDDFFCDILFSGCPDLIEKIGLLVSSGVNVNAQTPGFPSDLTALFRVVKKAENPRALIDLLLANGADIDAPSTLGLTPLHCAIILQNLEMVKYLISKGANPNAVDEDGASCLMLALLSNDESQNRRLYWPFHDIAGGTQKQVCIEILNELVRSGAKIDYGSRGKSVSDTAILTGEIANLDWLFENGVKPCDTVSSRSSTTLLMSACMRGDVLITSHLLQLGANVHAIDQNGETALFHTSDVKIATALLYAGAELTHLNKNGRSLFQKRYFSKALFLKFGKDFVRQGGDIHGTIADGRNILHHLADHYDGLAAIKLAIDLGCDVNVKDRNGTTPLMRALPEYWPVLLAAGARINDADAKGNHALHIHLSRELIALGADINCANKQGQTPLMLAAKKGDIRLVKALLKAGARPDARDKKGLVATDYAETKTLAALVELGAPLNPESTSALATVIVGKNASLAIKLLKAGLKARLSEWQVKGQLALLENIAQEDLDLFRGGIFGNDEKAEKLIAKIVAARDHSLDMAKALPVCGDEDLPHVLRLGQWPPQKPEPTAPISTQPPSPRAPEFRFPSVLLADCEQICEPESDERSAAKMRSDFSKLISMVDEILTDIENTDWAAETEKFIRDPIPSVYKASSSSRFSRAIEFVRHHEETAFNTFYIEDRGRDERKGPIRISRLGHSNTFEHSVSVNTQIATFPSVNLRIWSNDDNLLKDKSFILYIKKLKIVSLVGRKIDQGLNYREIGTYDIGDIKKHLEIFQSIRPKWTLRGPEKIHYCAVAYRVGPSVLDTLQLFARRGDVNALDCLSHLNAASLAPLMAESLSLPDKFKYAQSWFQSFPETAIDGLLECSFCEDIAARRNAQQALRLIAAGGLRQNILDQSLRFGEHAKVTTVEFLGHDAKADFLPKKMPKLPSYFVSSAHPAPTLKCSGEALPAYAIEALARMMLVSTCHVQTPAMREVMEACDPQSLADFALSVCVTWAKNGSKKDGIGFQHALGYLGDTRSALLLAKWYKSYPFNAGTEGGIEVLGVLGLRGCNTAIAGLQAIARFSKYDKAIVKAREVLEAVAFSRELTPALLEDLAVPDLGLDPNSRMSLDFGPRIFVVTLDSKLDAVLKDEGGNVLSALPKALKSDNAQKAKAATAQWKEFKAALKVQASDQKKRFEQAMLSRREWDGATFKEVVANHPLLSKMVRSLVWATVNGDRPGTAFRVDVDGRYVTADGAGFILADDERVILPHPVYLGGAVEIWLQIFAENKLTQPFLQLARKWFVEGPDTEHLISDRDGTKVPLGALRGLKAKGWEFKEGGAGMVWSVYKSFEGARASINVEPGWSLSGFDYEDFGGDQTVKLTVRGSDPIGYSELVRDFLSLPVATGEEP